MDKGKFKIITLPASRWQDYKQIRLRALIKEPLSFWAYGKEVAWSDEKWKQILKDALDGKCWLYFASFNGKLVGMIGGYGDELDWKNHRVYLWGLYVDDEFRGKGWARLLADKLLFEIGKREDVYVVCLEVNSELIYVVNFYEHLDFRKVGVKSHVFGDGLSHEVLVMEKVMH